LGDCFYTTQVHRRKAVPLIGVAWSSKCPRSGNCFGKGKRPRFRL